MRRDMEEFDQYFVVAGLKDYVEYHSDHNFEVEKSSVIIIDEADHFMFRNLG